MKAWLDMTKASLEGMGVPRGIVRKSSNTECFKKSFTMVFQMLLCGECLAYRLSILQLLEWWIICTPLSVNFFVTLTTQQHLEYHREGLSEIPYITSGSHIEP
jgi:hypothetical protein